MLSTYKLKIPPEKFERFLHIATGSETAEMLLASAKSGAIGSEIEALKEALPKLQELKSVTSSLAEMITLENKLTSGDEKTQQTAKEILQTMAMQLKDILKKYGAE